MVFCGSCKPSKHKGGEADFLLPSMKKLCPNLDREDGLDTVLEVPIPEETSSRSTNYQNSKFTGCAAWMNMRPHSDRPSPIGRGAELQLMLGVVGAPLVPLPVRSHSIAGRIKSDPIEVSMAKYIVRQYIAAAGGEKALESIKSMYAMGKVRMVASELRSAGGGTGKRATSKIGGGGEVGGFVLWQKRPELWCLELVVSGCKLSAGSDGKVAWRQTPWHQTHASRGPPRPLRRSLQGLDPRSTANLFSNSVCVGEKTINGEDCFVLRLDAEAAALRSRSSNSVDIIRHTVWGYFSTRTGLLSQLDDSHLLRINSGGDESIYWETIMESSVEDYRTIEGVNIAHAGRTAVSLFRFGENVDGHTRTKMEEVWTVEEVDFNIVGLSMDCFLPPGDLREEKDGGGSVLGLKGRSCVRGLASTHCKMGSSKVAALEEVGFEE